MLNQRFNYCFEYGKNAEVRFAESFLTDFNYSTKYQDIHEHWDVAGVLTNILDKPMKFDVKRAPRLKHSPTAGIMDLLNLTTQKLQENNFKKGKGDYKKSTAYLIHTRAGRKDKVTQVVFDDMKTIHHYEVNK